MWNYTHVMSNFYDENVDEDKISLWLQLFVCMALNRLFFPETPCGTTQFLKRYAHDVRGLGEYTWCDVI